MARKKMRSFNLLQNSKTADNASTKSLLGAR